MEFPSCFGSEIINAVLGGPRTPPVDLTEVAREIGVSSVRQTWSTRFLDGFTDFRSDRPIIYLGQKASRIRTRFIFAHELAHVMLRTPEAKDVMMRHGQVDLSEEERLANKVAASLLVPDSCVEEIRRSRLTPRRLEEAASHMNVSMMALVARLESAGSDIALLHWQKGKRSWYVVDRPGAPPCLHGRIQLSDKGSRIIENLTRQEADIVVDGRISGRYAKLSGAAYRDKGDAFLLLQPSRDIWLQAA